MDPPTGDSRSLPLFVYGTLASHGTAAHLIQEHVERRVPATARGRTIVTNKPYPAVRFRDDAGRVSGELVWLDASDHGRVLAALDRYEHVPRLFTRRVIRVRTAEGNQDAWAYEWTATADVVYEYLFAVARKIEVARYHLESLLGELEPEGDATLGELATIPVQAHFEGVLTAAVGASDQLAEALNIGLDLGVSQANLGRVLKLMSHSSLRERLEQWHQRPIAADYREVRRLVTHHWSVKTVEGPQIEVQPVPRRGYGGPRDLGSYTRAAVEHLAELEGLLPAVHETVRSSSHGEGSLAGSSSDAAAP